MRRTIGRFALPASLAEARPETDRLSWWQEARSGLFVHWGPVSLKGAEIGRLRGGERRGAVGTGGIPVAICDSLYVGELRLYGPALEISPVAVQQP